MASKQDFITLLTETVTTDSIGQAVVAGYTEKELPCGVRSATQSEQTEAYKRGFQAEYRCDVFVLDYAGEHLCEYKGTRYEIYRTYEDNDRMELYIGTRVGESDER